MRVDAKLKIFSLFFALFHAQVVFNFLLHILEHTLIQLALILPLNQNVLVANCLRLLHQYSEIVSFALFGRLGTFQVLLRNISPVAQAALHDALDQLDFLVSHPVIGQKRKIELVIDIVCTICLMLWEGLTDFAVPEAFKAHD